MKAETAREILDRLKSGADGGLFHPVLLSILVDIAVNLERLVESVLYRGEGQDDP